MFWKKIHHHASFIFLALLLLAQGLVLVASQARPRAHYDLTATFIEPTPYSSLALGESVNLQAKLTSKVASNFSTVYFTVANADKNISLNFEANKQEDGSWLADSIWQTTDWPGAIYQVSATANVVDADGNLVDSLVSAPQLVQLVDMRPEVAKEELTIQPSVSDQATSTKAAGDESLPMPTPIKYTTSTLPGSNVIVNNDQPSVSSTPPATDPISSAKDIILVSPENSSIISSQQLAIKLNTNFLADTVSVELINVDNAAISTGSIDIDKVDGLTWSKTIIISNIFIGGNYKLLVSADPKDETSTVEKAFDFILALPEADLAAQDLAVTLSTVSSNLSGSATLKALVTSNVNSAEFFITNSLTEAEVLRVAGVRKALEAGTGEEYLYAWDTKTVPNGNYFIYAQVHLGASIVKSEKRLFSVFNESNDSGATASSTDQTVGDLVDIPTPEQPVEGPIDDGELDCIKSGIIDQAACMKFRAELNGSFPNLCLQAGVYEAKACENFLGQNQVFTDCQDENITDIEKCKDYLLEKYTSQVVCQMTATSTCASLLRNDYLNRLVAIAKQQNILADATALLFNQTLSIADLNQKLKDGGLQNSLSTLITPELKVMIAKSQAETILSSADQLNVFPPAVLLLDTDSDLLPNDLEKYYGTDTNNADTDGDGYTDGEEVKNAYNPLGEGKLTIDRTALDQTILSGLSLEQPKESSLTMDQTWQVREANLQGGSLVLTGQADPATWVNIYLYSGLPILLTTKTDASGQWSYNLSASLSEGVHQAYVAINDAGGKIIKQSAALAFSVSNLPTPQAAAQTTFTDESPVKPGFQFVWWYFILAGVVILIIALIVILISRHRRQESVFESNQTPSQLVSTQTVDTQAMSESIPDNTQSNPPQ